MKILNNNNKTFVEEEKSFYYLQYEPIDINYYIITCTEIFAALSTS